MGGPPKDKVRHLPVGCSRAATRSAGRCMRLLPRVGRRRCTPAFGPLARITRADTRPLACRSGEAPEASWPPAIHCCLRTAHSAGARSRQRERHHAQSTLPGVQPQSTGHQRHRCRAPFQRWRVGVARAGTPRRKSGSLAGARERVLSCRARCHFSAVARSCCQTPR